jgi:hypothetical protein
MEEALVNMDQAFVADEESAEVAQVSKGSFHFPTLAVAAQRASILEDRASVGAMRADQLDAPRGKLPAKARAVVSSIHDEALRAVARTARSQARHFHCGERLRREGDLCGRGAKESASQRNTRAVCHHHPLRTFSAFGFTHGEPPFLAGAKLPSMNTSFQLSLPCASSSARNRRQMLSQISSSSQSRSLRQQVLALGYSLGRSRQRAPLRSTQRIPSSTARSSARGRPKLPGGGNKGWIRSHWWSLSKVESRIPSFPHYLRK